MNAHRRLVVILGPTASGKSALAIALAERLNGEVVACDSTQVYRYFDIGTGKVPAAERRGIPHRMIDLVEPEEVFTAGEYRRRATEVLEAICARGKPPILTAGTGLYLRALLEGLADAPARSEELRERLRQRAARRGPEHLYKILKRLDAESASRIAPGDTQKVIRAIEIRLVSGQPVSELHRRGRAGLEGFRVLRIGLMPPRAALYRRIDQRVTAMLESGWLNEAKLLLGKGITPTSKPFEFLGYSQLRDVLIGKMALDEAIRQIQQATRQYAKRQVTWFRKEHDVHWIEGFGDEPATAADALRFIAGAEE
ncbi:MAG TPA: tRNA (adenosine(37)-N6)-dimethylallyltransferase MiaA [Candidatus Acidoferrales bacterium]|nr:tRNA (adenosine(37)-N6)-dimethylallyltransferase MiaA [Candidatus Acidoferrales bacterium]